MAAILLIISVCLVIYCCRRWRKRSALSKGFRNIGNTFGHTHNMIGGTLDRKAMLESSSESSDTHQRSSHHNLHRNASGVGNNGGNIYDTHPGLVPSEPSGSSSNESSPRQMVRNQMMVDQSAAILQPTCAATNAAAAAYHLSAHLSQQQQGVVGSACQQQQHLSQATSNPLNPYCSSIPEKIVIPRVRHNQVNYAPHKGQVYMW